MIRAYDEILLPRACDSLGRMLDFSVYSLRMDAGAMLDLFTASGTAALFGKGDSRLICGMSGIELAYEVLDRSGLAYERAVPRHTRSLSGEYWCGSAIALAQWETGAPFEQILKSFPASAFIAEYPARRTAFLDGLPLDISSDERSAKLREFGMGLSSGAAAGFIAEASGSSLRSGDTPLKQMRIKNGLSQSALAKASCIPVRTIQQYEQRQKDLSRARAEYLIMLAAALHCSPSSLLEQ